MSSDATTSPWMAIVPTLGHSPLLVPSVAALVEEGGQVVVVAPEGLELDRRIEASAQIVRTAASLGFAEANLAGLRAADGIASEFIALVNDDAVVEPGWAAALLGELGRHPEAAAAQGLVLDEAGERIDGAGLAWNRWWQAVQIGHGTTPEAGLQPREIFGVSATASVYRRAALDPLAPIFDRDFGSYYEDVDLAVRLRAAGWTARLVPAARARHAGSTTGRLLGASVLVRRNRYLVLARALGFRILPRLPWMVLRDAVDAVRALARLDGTAFSAIVQGAVSGLVRWPGQALGGARLPASELQRWRP